MRNVFYGLNPPVLKKIPLLSPPRIVSARIQIWVLPYDSSLTGAH